MFSKVAQYGHFIPTPIEDYFDNYNENKKKDYERILGR